jgi:hypothetical protein
MIHHVRNKFYLKSFPQPHVKWIITTPLLCIRAILHMDNPFAFESQTPSNRLPSSHPSFRVTSGNLPLCMPPTISLTNSALVERLWGFFWSYHGLETRKVWTNGTVYQVLGLIKTFLLYNKESSNLEDIQQTSFELTSACLNFLQSWTEDPYSLSTSPRYQLSNSSSLALLQDTLFCQHRGIGDDSGWATRYLTRLPPEPVQGRHSIFARDVV